MLKWIVLYLNFKIFNIDKCACMLVICCVTINLKIIKQNARLTITT